MAKNPSWSQDEDDLIRKWYPEEGPAWSEWGRLLPLRSYRAIQQRASKIGVGCIYRGPRSWRKSEDRAAVSMLAEVCRTTGRSPEAVIRRLDHLMHEIRKRRREQGE